MAQQSVPIQEFLALVLKEGRVRILTLASLFCVAALATLGVGFYWPKKYSASSTILVEPRSTIAPGTGTAEAPHSTLVNQIITSKRILRELAALGGWGAQSDPRAEERLLAQLRSRIAISSSGAGPTGPTLVTLTYSDSQPQRALELAKKLTDIYIRESVLPEESTSRFNFEFVDGQVKEYSKTLATIHDQVLAYDRAHEVSLPGPSSEMPRAVHRHSPTIRALASDTSSGTSPPRASRVSSDELADLRQEEAALTTELGRTRSSVSADLVQTENRYRERVVQLQGELNRLLASYTDEHPDVKRLRGELARAQDDATRAKAERENAQATAVAMENDIKRATRSRLEEVQKKIAVVTGERPRSDPPEIAAAPSNPRARLTPGVPGNIPDPDMRVRQDAAIAELLRSYEATRDIYQELLKRREQQRVALELAEQRGLRLQVQEPPELPTTPVSIRLLHILLIGLLVAALLPVGLVCALVMLDGRIRSGAQLEASSNLPILVSIPHAHSPREQRRSRLHTVMAGALVVVVFIVYATFFYLRKPT